MAQVKCSNDIKKEIQDFHSSQDTVLILGYEADKKTIKIIHQSASEKKDGTGSVDIACEYLKDDTVPLYIILKYKVQIQQATTIKNVVLGWIPKRVKPMQKAKLSMQKSNLSKYIEPIHIWIPCFENDDLNEESILDELYSACGVKNRITKAKKYVANNMNKKVKQKTILPSNVRKNTELKFIGKDDFDAAIKNVRNDENDVDWVLISYKDINSLEYISSGSGGFSALRDNITLDKVYYGFFRIVVTVDNQKKSGMNAIVESTKFCFVKCISDKLSQLQNAKMATHRGYVTSLFPRSSCDFLLDNPNELTAENVTDKLSSLTGTKNVIRTKAEKKEWDNKQKKTRLKHIPDLETKLQGEKHQIEFQDFDGFKKNIANIHKDSSADTWTCSNYLGDNKFGQSYSGSGDINSLMNSLKKDTGAIGIIRVVDSLNCTKFCVVRWQPTSMPQSHKGQLSVLKSQIEELFVPFHLVELATLEDDLSPKIIQDNLERLRK